MTKSRSSMWGPELSQARVDECRLRDYRLRARRGECRRLQAAYPQHTSCPALTPSPGDGRLRHGARPSQFVLPAEAGFVNRGVVDLALDHEPSWTDQPDVWWAEYGRCGRSPVEAGHAGFGARHPQGRDRDARAYSAGHERSVFNPFTRKCRSSASGPLMRSRGFELLSLQDLNYCWNQLYWCDPTGPGCQEPAGNGGGHAVCGLSRITRNGGIVPTHDGLDRRRLHSEATRVIVTAGRPRSLDGRACGGHRRAAFW